MVTATLRARQKWQHSAIKYPSLKSNQHASRLRAPHTPLLSQLFCSVRAALVCSRSCLLMAWCKTWPFCTIFPSLSLWFALSLARSLGTLCFVTGCLEFVLFSLLLVLNVLYSASHLFRLMLMLHFLLNIHAQKSVCAPLCVGGNTQTP